MMALSCCPLLKFLCGLLALLVVLGPGPTWAEAARMGVITGDGVTLRSGPGTSFERLGRLQKGTWVTILDRTGDWLKVVGPSATVGWVFARWVEEAIPPATPPGAGTTVTTVEVIPPPAPPPPPASSPEVKPKKFPWVWVGVGTLAAGAVAVLATRGGESSRTGTLGFRVVFP